MHKDDKMTATQRLAAFVQGQEMDRICIMPVAVSISHRVLGVTHREKRASARLQADAQIACYERWGNDLMIIEYGLHGMGEAMGTKMNDPEDSVPAIIEPLLKDLDDIGKLDFSKALPENDPWIHRTLDACNMLTREMADECMTGVLISMPFTAVNSIYPIEKLLRATRKHPDKVHELMRKTTDTLKEIYKAYIDAGIILVECDPIASGTILHPKQFEEFVKPYTAEIHEFVHENKGTPVLHMCGDITKELPIIMETNPAMMSVDNVVDMEYTKKIAGPKVPILGNVDPVGVLLHGNRDEIFEETRIAIAKSHDSPNGFILASGCDITQNVPIENIDYFMEAGRYYGTYPLDLEKIGAP